MGEYSRNTYLYHNRSHHVTGYRDKVTKLAAKMVHFYGGVH